MKTNETKAEQFKKLFAKHSGNRVEMAKAILRVRSYMAGAILSRDWSESVESYVARTPEVAAVDAWMKTVTITPDFRVA